MIYIREKTKINNGNSSSSKHWKAIIRAVNGISIRVTMRLVQFWVIYINKIITHLVFKFTLWIVNTLILNWGKSSDTFSEVQKKPLNNMDGIYNPDVYPLECYADKSVSFLYDAHLWMSLSKDKKEQVCIFMLYRLLQQRESQF